MLSNSFEQGLPERLLSTLIGRKVLVVRDEGRTKDASLGENIPQCVASIGVREDERKPTPYSFLVLCGQSIL